MPRLHRFSLLTASDSAPARGSASILSIWWLCTIVVGVIAVATVGERMISAARTQQSADAIALALASGNTSHLEELANALGSGIAARSWDGNVITVVVKTPWGTGSASASIGESPDR